MCLRKKKNPQIFFLARVVGKVVQACHLPWKSGGTARRSGALFPAFSLEATAFISFLCRWLFSFQYLTGFFKVNSGSAQWDTCSFPTTGNKFARQACVSQIKSALFGMIYERNVMLLAFGCGGLRVWWWRGGYQVGRWVGECQICLTGRLICSCSEGARRNTHLCH